MCRFLPALCLILSPPLAMAQMDWTPRRTTAANNHRGTYHVTSGTWSAAVPAASSSSDVLYNNTAPTGYMFGTTAPWSHVDHGRIPSTGSPSGPSSVTGTRDRYTVHGFEIAYCSKIVGTTRIETSFFNPYAPCSDIEVGPGPIASFLASGLPAGTATGGQACWTVAFDLGNSTLSFQLAADGDGVWDDDPNIDSFGWKCTFLDADATNLTGPIIAGNCPIGGVTDPQQGFGTAFGGVPGATDATGLGTHDYFWIDSDDGGIFGTNGGCFFFGGCPGPGPVGTAPNPFGGFWFKIFGETRTQLGTSYCSSRPNATGSPATLSAKGGDVHEDLILTAAPVPNTTGLFYLGPMSCCGLLPANLGDGVRCVGGMTVRMLPFVGAGMMKQLPNVASLAVDYAAPYAPSLVDTVHFQYWFRSSLSVGTGSNTSDALRIDF